MSVTGILGLMIVVGVVVALVPIDPQIRRWVVIITIVLAVICLLRLFGLF